MTMAIPVQEFQIGQRVRLRTHGGSFVLGVAHIACDGHIWYGPCIGSPVFRAHELTLASERPPYVPSERIVIGREDHPRASLGHLNSVCRCETDAELAARHAVERDAYDRADTGEVVICDASDKPIGITGRTGQPGPGAA